MSEKRILLVTGASSDVGSALIKRTIHQYDKVLYHYGRSVQKMEALKEAFGEKIVPFQADFSIPEQASNMAWEILNRDLAPTHFVHLPAIPNANIRFQKTQWVDYEAQLMVQVHSAYVLCKAFLPLMAKKKFGRAVFMLTGNIVSDPPAKFSISYTTVKFALYGFAKCLAAEYSDKGVTVNCVSPQFFDSRFNSHSPELVRQLNANEFPMKRNLTVDDITPTLEFLLSDGASMTTGHNIPITGGR